MTVRIELRPEIEERVVAQAKERGLTVEDYVGRIVEDGTRGAESAEAKADPEAIEAMLDEWAEMGKDLPVIPLAALTREAMYEDHD